MEVQFPSVAVTYHHCVRTVYDDASPTLEIRCPAGDWGVKIHPVARNGDTGIQSYTQSHADKGIHPSITELDSADMPDLLNLKRDSPGTKEDKS